MPASSAAGYDGGLWNIGVNVESMVGRCIMRRAVAVFTIMTGADAVVPMHAVPRSSCGGRTSAAGVTTLPTTGYASCSPSTPTAVLARR